MYIYLKFGVLDFEKNSSFGRNKNVFRDDKKYVIKKFLFENIGIWEPQFDIRANFAYNLIPCIPM